MLNTLALVLLLPWRTISLVKKENIFIVLNDCYAKLHATNKLSRSSQADCLQSYLTSFHEKTERHISFLGKDALSWIETLAHRAHNRHFRPKRFSGKPFPVPPTRRIRKEIRTMSTEERKDFFDAVNALKSDTVSHNN